MKFDLKGFQKISKDGNVTKLQHPAGHTIEINHSILSPKMRGEIEALPSKISEKHPDSKLMADGGYNDPDIPEPVIEQSEYAFKKPKPKPTPEPTREERYAKIREDAAQQFGHSSAGYAEGGKVKYAEAGEVIAGTPNKDESLSEELKPTADQNLDMVQDRSNEGLRLPSDIELGKEEQVAENAADESPQAEISKESEEPGHDLHSNMSKYLDAARAEHLAKFGGSQLEQQEPSSQNQPQSNTPQSGSQQPVFGQSEIESQQPSNPVSAEDNISQANTGIQSMIDYINKQEDSNEKLGQKVINNDIDPKRLYKNMSTGSRVVSTIGLILGGLGAGASGGRNLAAESMQKIIDQDVEAQKSDQSKNMNLYKMNLEATKNEVEAKALTNNQLLSVAQAELAKQAAGTQNQLGQLQVQEAIQKIQALKMENAQNAYRYKAMQDIGKSASNVPSGQIDLDKFNKLEMAGVIPKEDISAATKEANAYQEKLELQKDMNQSAKHLNSQLGAGAFTPSDRQSAINAFAGRIAKLGEGRFNLEESKLQAQALLPSPLDSPSTSRNKDQRREAFFNSIAQTPTLDRYRLINHQSAPVIKQMGGVSYQLGSDGNYHKLGK